MATAMQYGKLKLEITSDCHRMFYIELLVFLVLRICLKSSVFRQDLSRLMAESYVFRQELRRLMAEREQEEKETERRKNERRSEHEKETRLHLYVSPSST